MDIIDQITQIVMLIGTICTTVLVIVGALTAAGVKRTKWLEQVARAAEIGVKVAEQWAAVYQKENNGEKPSSAQKFNMAAHSARAIVPNVPVQLLNDMIEAKVADMSAILVKRGADGRFVKTE